MGLALIFNSLGRFHSLKYEFFLHNITSTFTVFLADFTKSCRKITIIQKRVIYLQPLTTRTTLLAGNHPLTATPGKTYRFKKKHFKKHDLSAFERILKIDKFLIA